MPEQAPLLAVENLSKRFGNLQTLTQISFNLYPGEIVGLAGRNGAGKTTLVSILAGLQAADSGRILLDGLRMLDSSGYQPLQSGVGVIHQQPELAEQLDVTANIFLGQELNWPGLGRWFRIPSQRRMDEQATQLLTRLEAPFIPLREKVQNLSAEHRQLIAIARVLATPKRLILIDNPSLLLSIPYQQKLLQLTEEWRRAGSAILFCSNNLDHLFAVSDRILVLRQGELVASAPTDEITREAVVESLVGTDQRTQRTPAIWALDSYYLAREQAETLKHNQQLLEQDLKARDQLNQQLVDQLAEQIRALDSANLALQDAQRRLLTEREEERKFLAREIHDQAIQDLLSLNYELEEIEERVANAEVDIDDIVNIRESIRRLVEDLRRICGNLRPPTIDNLGLDAALRSYTQEWSQRTGIAVKLDIYEGFGRLPEGIELSIFRMIQEGLNNIRKHANATEALVSLRPTSPRLLLISISDNGDGMQQSVNLGNLSRSGHYGLLGISERTALLGGRLRFENQKSGGLLVQIEVPHPRVAQPVRG